MKTKNPKRKTGAASAGCLQQPCSAYTEWSGLTSEGCVRVRARNVGEAVTRIGIKIKRKNPYVMGLSPV